MLYYVFESDLYLDDDFACFTEEPESFRAKKWISAESLTEPFPEIQLVGDNGSPTKLSDILLTGFQLQIFSPKLRKVLNDSHVTNIQYLPITIINRKTKKEENSFQIANILGSIDCLDMKHSVYTRSSSSGTILRVSRFQILEEKIVPLKGTSKPPLMFRLGEFKRLIIVHEKLKTACEDNKITGLSFTPLFTYV